MTLEVMWLVGRRCGLRFGEEDHRDFLICLVMVGWKGKNVIKEGAVDLSCRLNCLRVSLLEFSSFCLTLYMILSTLSGRCPMSILYGGGVDYV